MNRGDVDSIVRVQAADVVWPGRSRTSPSPTMDTRASAHLPGACNEAWDDFAIVPERFIDLGGRVLVLAREQGGAGTAGPRCAPTRPPTSGP